MRSESPGSTVNEVQLITVDTWWRKLVNAITCLSLQHLFCVTDLSLNAISIFTNKCKPKENRRHKHKASKHDWTTTILMCLYFWTNTCMWASWIKLISFLPVTSIVKLQVALFPDWSTAVYVIMWIPWLNLWSGWWFDVTAGRIPELSVAAGSVQLTSAENRPRSAYTTNERNGQVTPNVGGRISAKWTSFY